MLLRGVNAVGYTSYADNVVNAFVKEARVAGVDIFRVFDSLNYIDNLKFGIDSVHQGGGVAEGTLCYTGDVSNPSKKKVCAKPIRSSMHCVNMLLYMKPILATTYVASLLCHLSSAAQLPINCPCSYLSDSVMASFHVIPLIQLCSDLCVRSSIILITI